MKRRLVVGLSTLALGAALGGGVASADIVGVPGEPNCFGVRTSHAASSHKLTPPERAARASQMFGEDISVREVMEFVRTCPPPPPGGAP